MSWKSLVCTGLLCVLASPVFAVPSLQITNGGLNASGDWVWNVAITPTGGHSLGTELGFTTGGRNLLTATNPNGGAGNWDTDNPGTPIFGWETLTDVDPGAGTNMKAVGLQVSVPNNQVFSAKGSGVLTNASSPYLTVTTVGPTDTNPTVSLSVSGKYGAGTDSGRISEATSASASTNYSNFKGTATRTLVPGDANLSGVGGPGAAVTLADLTILATNLNKPGSFTWAQGDFNGSASGNEVTLADLTILATHLNKAAETGSQTNVNITGIAGGAGSVVNAPEPASVALIGLASLGCLGLFRRMRQG